MLLFLYAIRRDPPTPKVGGCLIALFGWHERSEYGMPAVYLILFNKETIIMRLDKYLKVSRLIKRRTVANEACDAGRVLINGTVAKAGTNVKVGDKITIQFGNKEVNVEVTAVEETVRKEEAKELYKYI